MKIIQMIYSLCSGGAEKFVVDLSNQLAESGHEVILCMLRSDEDGKSIFNRQFLTGKVRFHSMKFDRGINLTKIRLIEHFLLVEKPDVVHCHLNVIPYIFRFALFHKKLLFIHTLHSVANNTGGVGVQYYINRFFYKMNIIRPVCISKLCQDSYIEYYKLSNAPFIDNGRALIPVSPSFAKVKTEIEGYKYSLHTFVFIHVARYNSQKNQQLLIDSFNKLNAEGRDYILLVIGSGFDCKEGINLQQSACDKIHFLGEKNNVNDYLQCADAFCLTSTFEGLPISLLEAISCGVTPICTPVGGIPDVIIDGKYGYLSSDLSVDAFSKAVQRYIDKPIDRNCLRDYFHRNYSMEICAERYLEFYNKQLVNGKSINNPA